MCSQQPQTLLLLPVVTYSCGFSFRNGASSTFASYAMNYVTITIGYFLHMMYARSPLSCSDDLFAPTCALAAGDCAMACSMVCKIVLGK